MIGRYQLYFSKLHDEMSEIVDRYDYKDKSKAFAHWYLSNFVEQDEQEIGESLIDGFGDNGIDAIIIENKEMHLYQFKFPNSERKVQESIDEKTILKLINGYKKLLSPKTLKRANELFLSYKELIKEMTIFTYKFIFVSFSEGLSIDAKETLDSQIEDIKRQTGNSIEYDVIDKKRICDIYDKIHKNIKLDLTLKYCTNNPAYSTSDDVSSSVGFLNAKDLISVCKDHMDVLFDENIRLYEGDRKSINAGIIQSATGSDSKNFYYYHNGIVFICDRAKNSIGSHEISLEGASVVNGCQTITSLAKAYGENQLKDDVFIQYRVIQTSDFDLRAKITEYLNSQIPIRESYFLANNPFIRDLQSKLIAKGYYLERLNNEYSYKRELNCIDVYPADKVIKLEKAIQIFAGFYFNEYAANAKRGKSFLFDEQIIDDIIKELNPEKLIKAYEYYIEILNYIRLYRRTKRSNKDLFFTRIGLDVDEERFQSMIDAYSFMNTSDILLLNIVANIEKVKKYKNMEECIKKAISICHDEFNLGEQIPYSLFTRSNAIYENIAKRIQNEGNN